MTYFGHSLGGLFGAYVMLTQTSTFTRYILSSPSLWWDHEYIFGLERKRVESGEPVRTSAFVGIGSLETDEGRRAEGANLAVGHPAKPPAIHLDMVENMHRFVGLLRGREYPELELQAVEIEDEFHATVPAAVLSRALRHFRL